MQKEQQPFYSHHPLFKVASSMEELPTCIVKCLLRIQSHAVQIHEEIITRSYWGQCSQSGQCSQGVPVRAVVLPTLLSGCETRTASCQKTELHKKTVTSGPQQGWSGLQRFFCDGMAMWSRLSKLVSLLTSKVERMDNCHKDTQESLGKGSTSLEKTDPRAEGAVFYDNGKWSWA